MVGGDAFAPKRLIGVPKVFAGREPAFSDANDEHDQEPKQDRTFFKAASPSSPRRTCSHR